MIAEVISPCSKTGRNFEQEANQWVGRIELERTSRRPPGILVVDDDLGMRMLLNIVLNKQGIVVWLTSDGEQALKAYRDHRDAIDLVLLDIRMPGLDGPETLAALREVNPQLRCCFMTGDPGRYSEEELLEQGAERIIYKPFRLAEWCKSSWS